MEVGGARVSLLAAWEDLLYERARMGLHGDLEAVVEPEEYSRLHWELLKLGMRPEGEHTIAIHSSSGKLVIKVKTDPPAEYFERPLWGEEEAASHG